MQNETIGILHAISEEKTQDEEGKQPLDGEEFEKEETTLSTAVKKYFNKIAVKLSAL